VLSEELCILSSCFLSPMNMNLVLGGIESYEIGSHPGRDLLKCTSIASCGKMHQSGFVVCASVVKLSQQCDLQESISYKPT